MCLLASMYERGLGTSRDLAEATKWYTKAATYGNFGAKAWLEHPGDHSQAEVPPIASTSGEEMLRNSNFAAGNSHWDGDGEKIVQDALDNDNPFASPQTSNDATGLVVKLKNSEWTKVAQDFESRPGNLRLTVTYSVSTDFKFSNLARDYANLPQSINFNYWDAFATQVGDWVVMLCDVAARHQSYREISPPSGSAHSQTYIHIMTALSGEQETICLAFPPGQGTIILQKVSLIPDENSSP